VTSNQSIVPALDEGAGIGRAGGVPAAAAKVLHLRDG